MWWLLWRVCEFAVRDVEVLYPGHGALIKRACALEARVVEAVRTPVGGTRN